MKKILFLSLLVCELCAFAELDPSCCAQEIISTKTQELQLENPTQVRSIYQNTANNTLWDRNDLIDFIKTAHDKSLNYLSLDYHQDEIEVLMQSMDVMEGAQKRKARAKIDLLATDGFLSYSRDIFEGLIDWEKFQSKVRENEIEIVWEHTPKSKNYKQDLTLALKTNMLSDQLYRYAPQNAEYKRLVEAYERYEKLILPVVDYGKPLGLGGYGYRVTQLKAYLAQTGDLKDVSKRYLEFPTFDEKLQEALKSFQKRHYINESGELDSVTVLYTRKSVMEKCDLMKLNIERHKIFTPIADQEYMTINVPEFSLKYYTDGNLVDDIFVVVGREDRPTPIFSDALEYIVLNPSWVVPQNLMRKDYIPQLVSNPNSLEEHGIHIHKGPSKFSPKVDPSTVNWESYLQEGKSIPYYFMQYPGEDNVLGSMKFIFPNKYNVYLHDTNAKSLTTEKYRLFSSGCVRLSKPYDLLHILASHTSYDYETLVNMISSEKSQNIPLKKHIPIHIRYFTAFVNEGSDVAFRKDFYGIDAMQQGALRK